MASLDPLKLVGVEPSYLVDNDFVYFDAHTKAEAPGVKYPPDESSGIVRLLGPTFECSGPRGSVTCRAAIDGSDERVFFIPSFAYGDLATIGGLPKVDFYSLTFEIQLDVLVDAAIGCNPGDETTDPSCIIDHVELGQHNLTVSVLGPAAPPVSTAYPDSSDPAVVIGSVMRLDDPADWPYQNPDAANVDQGQWMFSSEEIDTVIAHLDGLDVGGLDFVEDMHVRPWRWSYGYGPPQPGAVRMVL